MKSSFCGSSACVDVVKSGGRVIVRNSNDSDATSYVSFSEGEWDAFVAGVKKSEFDYGNITAV